MKYPTQANQQPQHPDRSSDEASLETNLRGIVTEAERKLADLVFSSAALRITPKPPGLSEGIIQRIIRGKFSQNPLWKRLWERIVLGEERIQEKYAKKDQYAIVDAVGAEGVKNMRKDQEGQQGIRRLVERVAEGDISDLSLDDLKDEAWTSFFHMLMEKKFGTETIENWLLEKYYRQKMAEDAEAYALRASYDGPLITKQVIALSPEEQKTLLSYFEETNPRNAKALQGAIGDNMQNRIHEKPSSSWGGFWWKIQQVLLGKKSTPQEYASASHLFLAELKRQKRIHQDLEALRTLLTEENVPSKNERQCAPELQSVYGDIQALFPFLFSPEGKAVREGFCRQIQEVQRSMIQHFEIHQFAPPAVAFALQKKKFPLADAMANNPLPATFAQMGVVACGGVFGGIPGAAALSALFAFIRLRRVTEEGIRSEQQGNADGNRNTLARYQDWKKDIPGWQRFFLAPSYTSAGQPMEEIHALLRMNGISVDIGEIKGTIHIFSAEEAAFLYFLLQQQQKRGMNIFRGDGRTPEKVLLSLERRLKTRFLQLLKEKGEEYSNIPEALVSLFSSEEQKAQLANIQEITKGLFTDLRDAFDHGRAVVSGTGAVFSASLALAFSRILPPLLSEGILLPGNDAVTPSHVSSGSFTDIAQLPPGAQITSFPTEEYGNALKPFIREILEPYMSGRTDVDIAQIEQSITTEKTLWDILRDRGFSPQETGAIKNHILDAIAQGKGSFLDSRFTPSEELQILMRSLTLKNIETPHDFLQYLQQHPELKKSIITKLQEIGYVSGEPLKNPIAIVEALSFVLRDSGGAWLEVMSTLGKKDIPGHYIVPDLAIPPGAFGAAASLVQPSPTLPSRSNVLKNIRRFLSLYEKWKKRKAQQQQ